MTDNRGHPREKGSYIEMLHRNKTPPVTQVNSKSLHGKLQSQNYALNNEFIVGYSCFALRLIFWHQYNESLRLDARLPQKKVI